MVQNGKLAACAFALDKQLNKVDFPTLGNPTMPHCNAIFLKLLIFELENCQANEIGEFINSPFPTFFISPFILACKDTKISHLLNACLA
jgi:hypothetical protein